MDSHHLVRRTFLLTLIISFCVMSISSIAQEQKRYRPKPIDDNDIVVTPIVDTPNSPDLISNEQSGKDAMATTPRILAPLQIPAASITPTIDGIISPGEWTDALVINQAGGYSSGNVTYMKNDACYLYMAAKVAYPAPYNPNNATMINVYFDLNQNGQWNPQDGNLTFPAPGNPMPGYPLPGGPGVPYYGPNTAAWGYLGLVMPKDYMNFNSFGPWGSTPTGQLRYHRPWWPVGVGIPLTQIYVDRKASTSTEFHIEAKIDVVNSPLKMTPNVPINMRFQWYNGYYLPNGAGTVLGVAMYPTWNVAYNYNGPTPSPANFRDIQTTFVPTLGDILDVASIDIPAFIFNLGSPVPASITATTNPPPQNTNWYATFTGPLPAVGTTTFNGTVTFTTAAAQTKIINIPTTGLTKGFYDLEISVDDPGPCGILKKIVKFRILILGQGEDPCIVWPGDMNNDGSCNLTDRNVLQKYIFDANLNPLWLNGPTRYLTGVLTSQSSPLDIFNWVAQPAIPWFTQLGCYVDADGSGKINNFDLWAIKFNMGKTHSLLPDQGDIAFVTSPQEFLLYQNYPNPFNPMTNITYELPEESYVTLKVTDVLGREVQTLVNQTLSSGSHHVQFIADNIPSGIYNYIMIARGVKSGNEFTRTMRMSVTK